MFAMNLVTFKNLDLTMNNKTTRLGFYVQYTEADVCSSTKRWITNFTGNMTREYLHKNVSEILLFEILVLMNSFVLE